MKKFLLIVGILAVAPVSVQAELTVDDTVSDDFLRNHGHSQSMIIATQHYIREANGEDYQKDVEHKFYETPVAKYVRRVFMYIDPALDDGSFYNHHNINTSPKWSDL